MMRQQLTTEQLTKRWEDQRSIKNLMGKYTIAMLLEEKSSVFSRFWSQEQEDVCLGFNHGWYKGAAAIQGYYDALANRTGVESQLLQTLFPQQLGDWPDEKLYGVGHMDNKPVSSPLISVADDGETAQAMWTCVGCYTDFSINGPVSHWVWGYYAADFIRESDDWKLWHLRFITDIDTIAGQDWTKEYAPLPELPEFSMLSHVSIPQPNVPCTLQESYHLKRLPMKLPPLPHPYLHFVETTSYGL